VQLFEEWGERDYGRPRRNMKQGMLPPKLAHMMVNMLGLKPRGTLLDPFCGSGTVLMEAALLDWKHLMATDKNAVAVKDTQVNMQWIKRRYGLDVDRNAFQCPIETLGNKIGLNKVQAIVTEPFLGQLLARPPNEQEVDRLIAELLPLYRTMLAVFAKILEPRGRVVFIMPQWLTAKGRTLTLPALEEKLPQGMRQLILLSSKTDSENNSRLVYNRPDQYVGREIVVLEKVA
jgi:tRNA G10  N-methylase Trm11